MDGESVTMLQRAADIIHTDFDSISPEAIAAFLYILSQPRITIHQLCVALSMQPSNATRIVLELSQHQKGAGLINVELDGDMYRVISVSAAGEAFASRLGYVLKS